ncbi:uncharacterized protein LOC105689633 [Athalia rosae]|uniref:uncharacterized protein LOC105689633 n=1 Tax=Athalia rosae TaxID=37344 RepID=UPI0006253EC9|nr:uncharacterized protein LOC105689633 [Athalia rosae]
MEESTRLTDARSRSSRSANHHNNGQSRSEFGDDECSTDSGCGSGGSTGSTERLSRRGSGERLCSGGRSPRGHCYLDRLRGHSTQTRSQERLSRGSRSSDRCVVKSMRSWSPVNHGGIHSTHHESPSHSPSFSDTHSSDGDSSKRCFTTETLRKAFQTLKLSSNRRETKEKKHVKKSQKSILRSPVSYTYVRGLSGLPTHRVPRNSSPQSNLPCITQDMIGLNR